ncbi:uncharacterized protein J4E78_009512 [Alternaria triticimaculans]|uniref:uncharacterized protein n=1 Tax=Alternaria triticimaculans TaxID=297637 RepID=UPI0020C54BB6|nr:uncharacterized protein J4E78_009512 [Alternaria triticimaculans]KAI4644693.1 hypothetical protein J4E78_009512 [Alternaria triticimaculans]
MAYCSLKWRKEHGCMPQPNEMVALRPGMNQVADLQSLGIVQAMSHVSMDVLPNMDHTDVKEYYAGHTVQHSHRVRVLTPIVWINESGKKSAAASIKFNSGQAAAASSKVSSAADHRIPNSQVHDLPFIDPQLARAIRQVTEEPSSHPPMAIPGLWLQPQAPPDNKMQLQIIPPANTIVIPPSGSAPHVTQEHVMSPIANLQLYYEKLLHERDERELQHIAESKDKDRMIRTLKALLGWPLD